MSCHRAGQPQHVDGLDASGFTSALRLVCDTAALRSCPDRDNRKLASYKVAGNRPHKTSHILLVSDHSGRGLPQSKTQARCVAAGNSRSVLDCASPLALYHRPVGTLIPTKIWQTRLRFTSARQEQSANIYPRLLNWKNHDAFERAFARLEKAWRIRAVA